MLDSSEEKKTDVTVPVAPPRENPGEIRPDPGEEAWQGAPQSGRAASDDEDSGDHRRAETPPHFSQYLLPQRSLERGHSASPERLRGHGRDRGQLGAGNRHRHHHLGAPRKAAGQETRLQRRRRAGIRLRAWQDPVQGTRNRLGKARDQMVVQPEWHLLRSSRHKESFEPRKRRSTRITEVASDISEVLLFLACTSR